MKQLLCVALLSLINLGYAQDEILDMYPKGQYFYYGGEAQFYKEAHDVLVGQNLDKCPEDQIYLSRIIVTKEGKIKLIADQDLDNIKKNQCAYDVSIKILKGLKNWTPAEVNDRFFGAVADFVVYPNDIIENYKEGYRASANITPPSFPAGTIKYDEFFHDTFYSLFQDYSIQGGFNLEYFIDINGEPGDPRVFPVVFDKQFNQEFLRTFSRLKKKKWKPALYKDKLPIKYKLIHDMQFSVKYKTD